MNTDKTDLAFARKSMWICVGLTLAFLAVAVYLGIHNIHPGEVLPQATMDGGKAWAGYGLILLIGFGIGASGFATFVFGTFYKRTKARLLRVSDGTVDGQ